MKFLPRKKNKNQRGKQGRKQGGNFNLGVGKTGLELRYHKPSDYNSLTQPKKEELQDY